MTTTYTVSGSAIDAHGCVGCAQAGTGSTYHVTGYAINAHSLIGCPLTLEITPNAQTLGNDVDLVFEVWSPSGALALDNATVGWVAHDINGTAVISKSTADYSVITFDNTLVVHLNAEDGVPDQPLYYTANIATASGVYMMSGQLFIESIMLTITITG